MIAAAMRANPELRVVVVVPRCPTTTARSTRVPSLLGRQDAMRIIAAAGGERFAVYDLENHEGTPVYVHAKVVVVDDVWAMVGSDNLNRRSWSHDSELSIAVLDESATHVNRSTRPGSATARGCSPGTCGSAWPASISTGPTTTSTTSSTRVRLRGLRPSGGGAGDLVRHRSVGGPGHRAGCARTALRRVGRLQRTWAVPMYRLVYDPDGRPWRDRLRRRL